MGPRADARGNPARPCPQHLPCAASMGPRADARGNGTCGCGTSRKSTLQWGRELTLAEIGRRRSVGWIRPPASMGPRADARGNETVHSLAHKLGLLQWGRELTLAE